MTAKFARRTPVALAAFLAFHVPVALAQATPPESGDTLAPVTVRSSADASAQGLSPAYPGGQVARGGRAGILGTRDAMQTPFSITGYTNELIQDRQAHSVGEVLQNDPSVRVARGFGNFQESYFIRGFILSSDDIAYNGLYGLLPRQYISTELFERVEVLRGASAFLTGATPGGGGIGGAINLLPKRAPNEPLTRVTAGAGSGGNGKVAADIARRFGPDDATGIRVNAAHREGGTGVDDENGRTSVAAVGVDWRSRDLRLSGDIGYQDNQLKAIRPNVGLAATVTRVPAPPDASANFAQPWTYSNERDLFGTVRGEWDLTPAVTAWGAYGMRRSKEANSLADFTVADGATGAATTYRFDNTRKDRVDTGELGLRGKARTGAVGHEWVAAASWFALDKKNAFAMDFLAARPTNLYTPTFYRPQPPFGPDTYAGNTLSDPALNGRTRLVSFAVGDTLSFMDDRLLLTVGARHQRLKVDDLGYTVSFGGVVTPPVASSYDESRTSPAVAMVYKAGKQLSVYANYIEGLTQGDTVAATPTTPVRTLAPYVSKQREIGVKYDGGRLGGSIAVFATDKPRTLADSGLVLASGEDSHRGVEVTVHGEAMRGLRLLGGVTWLDARQRDTGVAGTEGKRVIGVPSVQGSFGVEWDLPGLQGVALDARVVATGASYANAANTLKVPGWGRVDAGVRYLTQVQGRLVTLRARVDNIADRNYWASVGGYPGNGYLVAGGPRTFSLSASVDF